MVLIADDHDESRRTQRLVLEHFGFAVTEAQNGLDAWPSHSPVTPTSS
jgi:CheY-like chemotaxis protein